MFGYLTYALKHKRQGKFHERGSACIFIGTLGQKGYKVYDTMIKESYVSRDVIFF